MQFSSTKAAALLVDKFGPITLKAGVLLSGNWVEAIPNNPKFSIPLSELGFTNSPNSLSIYETWRQGLIAIIASDGIKTLSTNPLIELLKALGANQVILSATAWSLDPNLPVGTTALVSDHINLTGRKPSLAKHLPETATPYSATLNDAIRIADPTLRTLVALQIAGPQCETSAEYRMFRMLGADAVTNGIALDALVAQGLGMEVSGLVEITKLAPGVPKAQFTTVASTTKLNALISTLISVL